MPIVREYTRDSIHYLINKTIIMSETKTTIDELLDAVKKSSATLEEKLAIIDALFNYVTNQN